MENGKNLAIWYLIALIAILSIAAVAIVRQVLKTRRVEMDLSRLQRKLSKEKGTAREHYDLGSMLLKKKLYSQAIPQFQKALKSKDLKEDMNAALIYNALGFTYAAQEQYDLAIRQYKEALERYPAYVVALKNLGLAYEKKNLILQAIEAYESVLQCDAENKAAKRRLEKLKKRIEEPTKSEAKK